LAVPKQLVEFNSDYQKDVSQHIDLIREIINNMDSELIPISHYEVTAAIIKLNNKKSGDELGISAEHFKLTGQYIVAALVELFNVILEHGYIPPQFLS
jgi:hemoglobin-like flavoprotein